jgi:hypothetical protein
VLNLYLHLASVYNRKRVHHKPLYSQRLLMNNWSNYYDPNPWDLLFHNTAAATHILKFYFNSPNELLLYSHLFNLQEVQHLIKKSKAILVAGHGSPQGCEALRLPHCLDNPLKDAGKPLQSGRFLLVIPVKGWVNPRAIAKLEGLSQLKIQWHQWGSNLRPSGL